MTPNEQKASDIIENLPMDLRHSVRAYGINYPPLRDRLMRAGGVHNTPHPATCACELCRLLRKGERK